MLDFLFGAISLSTAPLHPVALAGCWAPAAGVMDWLRYLGVSKNFQKHNLHTPDRFPDRTQRSPVMLQDARGATSHLMV
uniref:Putative secreted peptide n=1 Tax=Anopheles braziliensis TaxID=58242 RepID=A0A2M3ZWD5_9DIPT